MLIQEFFVSLQREIKTFIIMEATELLYWMRKWELDDKLIYKKASENQAIFVRNKICSNLLKTHGFVVGHHHSKSCLLPVYFMKIRNGIKLIMRENFYDWKVSVEIPEEYADLPADYLPTDCLSYSMVKNEFEKIPSCYCEGFKKEWCYDAYNPKQPGKKFTIEIPDDECLYVIIHYLKHAYPDIAFNPEDDKRTVDEIKSSIDKILADNGFNDLQEEQSYGKTVKNPVMSAWEIIRRTYNKLDDMYYDGKMTVEEMPVVSDNSQEYAEAILKFPEAHAEFLMEEWMFKM